jgi:hypothetical protein
MKAAANLGQTAEALLSRLDGVKSTGARRWIGRCPAHDDRSPSLAVRELEDGRVLLHCFADCAVEDVLTAVGLTFDALYPDCALGHSLPREPRPFNPADILQCVAFESLVVAIGAASVAAGSPLADADRARLNVATCRLQAAAGAYVAR